MTEANGDANGVGHNSEGMTEQDRKALFFNHFRRIANKKAEVDAIREEYKTLRKEAKADGLTLSDIDFALKCAEVDDASIIPDELRRRTEIAAWFALPVDFQPDLFAESRPLDDRAYDEGKAAGLQGKDGDSPYDGPTGQEWMRGWHDGQAVLTDELVEQARAKNTVEKAAKQSDDADDGDPFEDGAESDAEAAPAEAPLH